MPPGVDGLAAARAHLAYEATVLLAKVEGLAGMLGDHPTYVQTAKTLRRLIYLNTTKH
jgi:hypothetical protein